MLLRISLIIILTRENKMLTRRNATMAPHVITDRRVVRLNVKAACHMCLQAVQWRIMGTWRLRKWRTTSRLVGWSAHERWAEPTRGCRRRWRPWRRTDTRQWCWEETTGEARSSTCGLWCLCVSIIHQQDTQSWSNSVIDRSAWCHQVGLMKDTQKQGWWRNAADRFCFTWRRLKVCTGENTQHIKTLKITYQTFRNKKTEETKH